MSIKQYRVICWQPSTSSVEDEIFVDIAPRFEVTHNMMFYSRLKLFRGNDNNKKIVSLAGSVYLNDIEPKHDIDIVFSQITDVPQRRLIPIILDAYKKMRSEGKETTLQETVSAWQAEQMSEEFRSDKAKQDAEIFERRERERRQKFADKHLSQTPKEETEQQHEEEFSGLSARKRNAMIDRARRDAIQDPISRMKAKMKQFSGD